MLKSLSVVAVCLLMGCETSLQEGNEIDLENGDATCLKVSVDKLYLKYKEYNNKRVCTHGKIQSDVGGSGLLPSRKELTLDGDKIIRLEISYTELLSLKIFDGDVVYIDGVFSYDRGCFGEFDTDEEQVICAPHQFLMMLSDVSIG